MTTRDLKDKVIHENRWGGCVSREREGVEDFWSLDKELAGGRGTDTESSSHLAPPLCNLSDQFSVGVHVMIVYMGSNSILEVWKAALN